MSDFDGIEFNKEYHALGATKNEDMKDFYDLCKKDIDLQLLLLEPKTKTEFVKLTVKTAAEYGYNFTEEEMWDVMSNKPGRPHFRDEIREYNPIDFTQQGFIDNYGSPEWAERVFKTGWRPNGTCRI